MTAPSSPVEAREDLRAKEYNRSQAVYPPGLHRQKRNQEQAVSNNGYDTAPGAVIQTLFNVKGFAPCFRRSTTGHRHTKIVDEFAGVQSRNPRTLQSVVFFLLIVCKSIQSGQLEHEMKSIRKLDA